MADPEETRWLKRDSARRLLISTVVLAASITLSCIHTSAQLRDGPQNEKSDQVLSDVNGDTKHTQRDSQRFAFAAPVDPPTGANNDRSDSHEEDIYVQRQIAVASGKVARFTLWMVGAAIGVGLLQLFLLGWQSASTRIAANAAKTSADAELLVQRAYVALSPREPGVLVSPVAVANAHPAQVIIQVHNWGKTPADVTAVRLRAYIAPRLPTEPPYDPNEWFPIEEGTNVFLVPDGNLFHTINFSITASAWVVVQSLEQVFWILGYVDYLDVFQKRHRGGFARRFDPHGTPNNLMFEPRIGYNYDKDIDEQGNFIERS